MTFKTTYSTPCIIQITLDNEISLVLESATSDPGEPGTIGLLAPEYFNNDPLKFNEG